MEDEYFSSKVSRIKIELIAAGLIAIIGVIYHFFYGEIAFKLGDQQFESGNYTAAIEYYTSAAKHKENFKEAFNARGLARLNLRLPDYENAELDFKEALKIDFNYAEAHYNLAETYLATGNTEKALEELARVFSIHPHYAKKINPEFANLYNTLGVNSYDSGKYSDALKCLNVAININPNLQSAYYWRGLTKKILKNYDQAIEDFNKAIELEPTDFWSYSGRGLTYDDLEKYQTAISDFNEAIRINPKHFLAYTHRAYSNYHLGNYDKSLADFNKALELAPNSERALEGKKKVLQELNKKQNINQNNNNRVNSFWENIDKNSNTNVQNSRQTVNINNQSVVVNGKIIYGNSADSSVYVDENGNVYMNQ